jgi:4-amino-4-deoxy-L-arabinose transferase-like glycosyltransferase
MNFGKILLLLIVISTAVFIFLNAPPRGTVVFFIILMLLATPFLYYFWTFRAEMRLMSRRTKLFAMTALAIMLVFAVWWYDDQYGQHVYISNEDPAAYLYFPLQENEVLSEMLEKGGGTLEGSVEQLGFEVVRETIERNTTKSDYLVTDAYFILVAILAYLSLFLFLIFLYLEFWGK